MKHWLIIHENIESALRLKGMLEKEDTQAVIHVANTSWDIASTFYLYPVDVVFITVNQWSHAHFSGKTLRFVFISGPREFFKEEITGPNLLTLRDEPYKLRDIILLMIKLEKALPLPSIDFLFIRSDRRIRKVFFKDILLIEKKENTSYCQLCTTEGKFMLLYKISDWFTLLPMGKFKRVGDKLILPVAEEKKIVNDIYRFENREILLTYRFKTLPDKLKTVQNKKSMS